MSEDDQAVPWNAPWQQGEPSTREERLEFAGLTLSLVGALLLDQKKPFSRMGKRDKANAARTLWICWSMVFSRPEFQEFIDAESAVFNARMDRAKEGERDRKRRARARKRAGVVSFPRRRATRSTRRPATRKFRFDEGES